MKQSRITNFLLAIIAMNLSILTMIQIIPEAKAESQESTTPISTPVVITGINISGSELLPINIAAVTTPGSEKTAALPIWVTNEPILVESR